MNRKASGLSVTIGSSNENPKMLLEWVPLLTATFSGTKLGRDMLKDMRSRYVPFEVGVLDSQTTGGMHHVFFRFSNNTTHGLYIERITIALPERRDQPLEGLKLARVRFDEWARILKCMPKGYRTEEIKYTQLTPLYIGAVNASVDTMQDILISFPELTERSFHETSPFLVLTIMVSHLNEKKVAPFECEFRIRWDK